MWHCATTDRKNPTDVISMRRKDTRGLAAEAAAIIAEGVPDWSEARRKLAEEYEITSSAQLPDDDAIESALREHYAIFDPKGHAEHLLPIKATTKVILSIGSSRQQKKVSKQSSSTPALTHIPASQFAMPFCL